MWKKTSGFMAPKPWDSGPCRHVDKVLHARSDGAKTQQEEECREEANRTIPTHRLRFRPQRAVASAITLRLR